jgi:hypothetical protein
MKKTKNFGMEESRNEIRLRQRAVPLKETSGSNFHFSVSSLGHGCKSKFEVTIETETDPSHDQATHDIREKHTSWMKQLIWSCSDVLMSQRFSSMHGWFEGKVQQQSNYAHLAISNAERRCRNVQIQSRQTIIEHFKHWMQLSHGNILCCLQSADSIASLQNPSGENFPPSEPTFGIPAKER